MTVNRNKPWGKIGFDGRVFLTKKEWEILGRASPVKYSRRLYRKVHGPGPYRCGLKADMCSGDGDIQIAHRIPFKRGMAKFGLTPDFLDRLDNLVPAHRKGCNNAAELTDDEILTVVYKAASKSGERFPTYLRDSIYYQ